MDNLVTIQGFEEAKKVLDSLPDKFQKQVVNIILRKSAKIFIDSAKSKCLAYGAEFTKLADSIGIIPVKTENPVVVAGIRVKGKYKYTGYIGAWVEYGVRGIKTKLSSTVKKQGDESFRMWVGKVKKGERYRDDQPPRPFMRPAADSTREPMQADVARQFENHLYSETEKALRRYARLKLKGKA